MGVYPLVAMLPLVAITGVPPVAAIGLWAATFAALGVAQRREAAAASPAGRPARTPPAPPADGLTGAAGRGAGLRERGCGNFLGLDLGLAYEHGAFTPDGTEPPVVEDPVSDYVPAARPGHRAPHVWLEHEGRTISTLDLFEGSLVLWPGPPTAGASAPAVPCSSAPTVTWPPAGQRCPTTRRCPLEGRPAELAAR